jgi:hypothetical protein
VVLLILGSLTNVVGYQSVQSSNQNIIYLEENQKDLLFQTIIDMANNKEIQGIILESQINMEGFLNQDVKFSLFNTPVLTKNQLKHIYFLGVMLSKIVSNLRINSIVGQYQKNNREVQNEINAVIKKDATLKEETTQLSTLKCDCGGDSSTVWGFPVLCMTLAILGVITYVLAFVYGFFISLFALIYYLMIKLDC